MPTAALPRETRRWTYEDYLALDDERRYEIINGELLTVPAPSSFHQRYSRNLEVLLFEFVRERKLGHVFHAPIDVILSPENVVHPDILFVARERRDIIQERGIFGPPDLVVEIVSPSSVHRDYALKQRLYERFGGREYWLVDPGNRTVDVLGLDGDAYASVSFASGEGAVTSNVLDGLAVTLEAVFQTEI
ncbi:hypothetical protein MIN45_P0828 [Methylomarinovum tepidoasis]|uniref:Putative restriction endonuclease domain-containing protein n=1 Tax=Methylomarinovum tepidoasis TaxID=2840183 RepID=A0AAU9C5K8_9GAMM|nr:Uma2 family endonuclease [Methylomarinovum sp. IN45]BCX88459.1 hypothetical protein MIN45_P0828 [Methylomarinovum sp. IN45]